MHKPVKADTGSTIEAVLARISAIENLLLPVAATAFPQLSPFVPAATALTGAAQKIVAAIDGVDYAPSAVATMAAAVAPAPVAAAKKPTPDEIAAARAVLAAAGEG